MKKLLLASLCFLMLCASQVFAQNRTVTGTVTAKDDGLPLPGVTVKVKGTTTATVTNAAGKYTVTAPAGGVLQFTFIGFAAVERQVGAGQINVEMVSSTQTLGEVVITGAFGKKLSEKAAGYAGTHLDQAEVNVSAPTNLLTGLAGKVAGLAITTTGTGVTPGIKVQLRGSRSINGNNQALIVVDGVQLPNGDISLIDPNTIESYDVLNGGSGAVLYGQEGSNGVIVITTKKGAAGKKINVTYSNSLSLGTVAYYPKIQRQFGQNGGENIAQGGVDPYSGAFLIVGYENELYGPAYDGRKYQLGAPSGSATGPVNIQTYDDKGDPVKAFYKTGIIEQNNIGVNSGDADDYFNLSAQHVLTHGITPFESANRYNASFKSGKRYGMFKAEYSLIYTNQLAHQIGSDYNSSGAQSVNFAIQQWPTDLRINDFRDQNAPFNNPSDFYNGYAANPWWAVYNTASNTTTNNLVGNLNLTLNPTKYLDINYKLTDNFLLSENKTTQAQVNFDAYSQTDPLGEGNIPNSFKAAGGVSPAQVSDAYNTGSRLQSDFQISLHPNLFKNFKTSLLLGNEIINQHSKNLSAGSNTLLVAGLYNIGYIAGTPNASEGESTTNTISFLGDASISYKDFAFLSLTLRNDQDSRLTKAVRSYWYPGINGSFVFTDAIPAIRNNRILSFGKLRAAYSITGQVGVGAYNIFNTYGVTGGGFPFGSIGGLSQSSTNYTLLVPERSSEIELGTELGFLNNRIHGTFTWYKQNNKNQTLPLGVSTTTGYSTIVENVGEMQSSGFEATLGVTVFPKGKNKVGWDLSGNIANQESKVISLIDNAPQFSIGNSQYAIVGMPYPYILGTDLNKDPDGHVIVSGSTGLPTRSANSLTPLGRTSPEWTLGLNTTVSYKFITFNATAEYRTGFVSNYQPDATNYLFTGSSAYTTQNGRQPFIWPNSVINTGTTAAPVYAPNTSVSTADGNDKFWVGSILRGTTGPFVTSGAFWKLREASVTFDLSKFVKIKAVKGVKLAVNGRNLAIWTPKTNFWGDPETSGASGNSGQVPSINSVPSQRVFGARLDVTF